MLSEAKILCGQLPKRSLNPCFNGICSQSLVAELLLLVLTSCLNPCFNGICSQRSSQWVTAHIVCVLILVLMEYALRERIVRVFGNENDVLILVLMEYALRVLLDAAKKGAAVVLILVLMEYALRARLCFN